MTVYGELTYATEIGMAVVVVGLGLPAIIARRTELRGELLIIMAGLLIPLAILQTIFSGLNDWKMGLTDLDAVIIPPLIVIWLSFVFWTTSNAICYCVDWYSIGVDTRKNSALLKQEGCGIISFLGIKF